MIALVLAVMLADGPRFVDATEAAGLGSEVVPEQVARVCFADLDDDGFPDAVIDRHRVFMNRADTASPLGRTFLEVPADKTGLVVPQTGTIDVFADLDNDGKLDAVTIEQVDTKNPKWVDHGMRTRWQRGNGDGTFGAAVNLPAPPRPTMCVAIADVNGDGWLDLFLGNSYLVFDEGGEAWPNDLLLSDGHGSFTAVTLPEEPVAFNEETDPGGRPTYGVMVMRPIASGEPALLSMSYGRRWNRMWLRNAAGHWNDIAPQVGFDGDSIRHGKYPEWLKEVAKTDPRFAREDEKPYRSNGNTFDAAAGDVDNDGNFDLFISEITHEWAGESSDRSRFLFFEKSGDQHNEFHYVTRPAFNVDRIPSPRADGKPNKWNQGDLFCELADLDADSRTDLVLSSGDYPDDERLRVYLQRAAGGLIDATSELSINHDGSQQISLGDVDGDGDLDLLVGQTFNRYSAEQIAGRSPHLKLLINESTEGRKSVTLRLRGGEGCNRMALGAIVTATLPDGTRMSRQLIGIGGHAGKQNDFIVHFGLGTADHLASVRVTWPDRARSVQEFADVAAGAYRLAQSVLPQRFSASPK